MKGNVSIRRPKPAPTPAALVAELLGAVRRMFYPESLGADSQAQKRWFQDQHFIRRNVVLWPAGWLAERGVTLPPERYRGLLLGVFATIRQHGDSAAVRCWPRYLMHCVQKHFAHNGEAIYEEAKSARALAEQVLLAARARSQSAPPDTVRVLAEARAILPRGRRKKAVVQDSCRQISLL